MSRIVGVLAAIAVSVFALPGALLAQTPPGEADSASVSIVAWHDLPKDDPRSQELSGIAWDEATRSLFAITDDAPRIVRLELSEDFGTLTLGEEIAVTIPDQWDGEGMALTSTGFLISNEVGPHVYELDHAGQAIDEVPLPGHFSRIRPNLSLESLTITPDQRYLFTANEQALDVDGPTSSVEAGTVVRILRQDRTSMEAQEWAYRTDPTFAPGGGGTGVTDLVPLSPTDLLVLERSFVPNVGNSVRIYRALLDGSTNLVDVETLSDETPVISKTLVVDLAMLPDADFPPTLQPQPNRILDNFEGLALGPVLPDGRQVLFVISDDNKGPTQIPRLLVLAAAGL